MAAERCRRYTPVMLRLTGLPPVRRFSEALLLRGEERLELRFCGAGETRSIEIPLWTLEGQDIESAELWLLAELEERGYRVRREP